MPVFNCNSDLKRKYKIKKEVNSYENDISTEKKAEKERTWIQKENENQQWKKCAQEKKIKRKKEIIRLTVWSENVRSENFA